MWPHTGEDTETGFSCRRVRVVAKVCCPALLEHERDAVDRHSEEAADSNFFGSWVSHLKEVWMTQAKELVTLCSLSGVPQSRIWGAPQKMSFIFAHAEFLPKCPTASLTEEPLEDLAH